MAADRKLVDPQHWPRLSRLLDEALEMSADAREGWLQALPEHESLYRDELRALLSQGAAAETRDFLNIVPNLKAVVDEARAAVRTAPLRPGSLVGPYVIEREIGSGGMGAVWLARRGDGLIKRAVALKLPHAGLLGRQLAQRFARERDILAELAHPNIARLYDAGFSDDGQPFLALEYVAGAPFIEYCDQHRLGLRQRLGLFQQVLHAVQYAHSSLVIHRDLKPSNVIVGKDGRAMLLDFGIARLMAVDPREESARNSGVAIAPALTPDYASPEQIAGHSVTTASDIYSLGVLLFELLTGERPRESKPSESICAAGVAGARGCTIRSLSAALSGDLDAIVLKALRQSPAERYLTANAFCEDIERYLKGEPIAVLRECRGYTARKFVARHKKSVIGAAVALTAIIATAAVALYEAHAAADHARTAAAERDRALRLSSRNEAVADFLNVLITEAAGSEKPLTIGALLARSEALVSAEFRGNQEHRTAVLDMVGSYYRTIGDTQRARQLLQAAFDTIRESPDADLRRKVTCDLALALASLGRIGDANTMLDRVIADPQSTAQQAAECLAYRSTAAGIGSDPAGAVRYGQLALARLRAAPQPSAAVEAGTLAAIGDGERLAGHSAVAESYLQRSLQQYARAGRERGPDATVIRNNLAIVHDATGNPKLALVLYNDILQTSATTDPTALPPVIIIGNRARALELVGRFAAAHQEYLRCTELSLRAELANMRVHCLAGLAWVSRELGEVKAAEHYLREATELARTVLPANGPGQVALDIARARIALANSELARARASLDSALAGGNTVYFQMAILLPRAELNLQEGRVPEAESDARQALLLAQKAQGGVPHSNRTGLSWLTLGKALARKNDSTGARQAFSAAIEHLSNTVDADHPMLLLARELARVHG